MATDNLYPYKELTDPGALRLLILQPAASTSEKLKCSLIHTTFDECGSDVVNQYTARSYVRGSPNDTTVASINGRDYPITKSLDLALRCIRPKVSRLWADALCLYFDRY